VHYVGHLGLAGVELPRPPAVTGSRPLVLVSQGTIDTDATELLQPAVAGLAGADVNVLVTSGHVGRPDIGVRVPARVQVTDLVDFSAALPATSVFVTNGGWGGVLAALSAGVPLVVAPGRAADKPEIAARVAAAGVGVNLRRRRPRPQAIAAAVRTVLDDPAYAERSRALADEMAALGGVRGAAQLLESLAAERP
jgi:UDP:flavonoid glycosyltransferase YjiC (YdhE family)